MIRSLFAGAGISVSRRKYGSWKYSSSFARIGCLPRVKISPSSIGRRRTSSGVIKGRRDSDSEVLTLRVDAVVCPVRTVVSPIMP